MTPTLDELEYMTRQAGAILLEAYGKRHQIRHKGPTDLVTEVDHRSESYLVGAIRERYPDHQVVTEERGVVGANAAHVWYVDPLDGTVNYAHDIPIFSVSVAYAENGELKLGVVYEPLRQECFRAARGQGAWLNEKPLQVSQVGSIEQSLLVTGFPYDIQDNPANNLNYYAYFSLHSQGVRRLGSAALDMCYVAAGRFDGYWELYVEAWDVAAGALIVQEAGGLVTRVGGERYLLGAPSSVLSANPTLHAAMLVVLNDESPDPV